MIVGRIDFGEGMVGGECPFIPAGDEEDDGYIATFVGRADGTGTSGERQRDSTISGQHAPRRVSRGTISCIQVEGIASDKRMHS